MAWKYSTTPQRDGTGFNIVPRSKFILELEDFSEALGNGKMMLTREAFCSYFDSKTAIVDEIFATYGFEEMALPRQLKTITEKFERERIVQALAKNRGRVTRAAKELGLSPQNLSYKIKKYDLKR